MTGSIYEYCQDIKQYPVLSRDEEIELAQKVEAGDQAAREWLVKCNLRLVVNYAQKYQDLGLDMPDVIAEGNLILIEYVDRITQLHERRFNWRLGFKLSTHFRQFFRSRIVRRIFATRNVIYSPYSAQMGKSGRDCNQNAQRGVFPLSNDLQDVLPDPDSLAGREPKKQDLIIRLQRIINNGILNDRERLIIKLRFFGEPHGRIWILKEIGERLGLTRERIRQIEAEALEKLREHL